MSQYFETLNPIVKQYFHILSPEIPEFLEDYIETPEMQRIGKISNNCGVPLTKWESGVKRINEVSNMARQKIENYLAFETKPYAYLDFDFK